MTYIYFVICWNACIVGPDSHCVYPSYLHKYIACRVISVPSHITGCCVACKHKASLFFSAYPIFADIQGVAYVPQRLPGSSCLYLFDCITQYTLVVAHTHFAYFLILCAPLTLGLLVSAGLTLLLTPPLSSSVSWGPLMSSVTSQQCMPRG